jgi:PAS domain S-box-containing protein
MEGSGGGRVAPGDLDVAAIAERVLRVAPGLVAITDLTTSVLLVSESWRSLGWDPSSLVGVRLVDLLHPDDLADAPPRLLQLQEGRAIGSIDLRLRTAEGGYRWLQGTAAADLDAGHLYFSGIDITERKELEARLRRQLSLEELVAAMATRLIGAEPAQVIDEIRRSVEELARAMDADRGHFLRGHGHELDVANYVEWRNPDTAPREHSPTPDLEVQSWWRRAMRENRLLRLDRVEELEGEAPHVVAALREDGVRSLLHVPLPAQRGRWGFLTMVAVRGEVAFGDHASSLLRLAGECFMTALAQRDDTLALEDAQRELQQRNEDLERSNEGLEGFAYAAAHDLKAPLSRVEMALAATPALGGTTDELLGIARRASSRMRQLIEDLLTFAAAGSPVGPPGIVDLDDLLTQVLSDLEPSISGRGVTVERERLPSVMGYRLLLGQLLQNLLGNAVKFTQDTDDPRIRIDVERSAHGVTIAVRDNGIGIDPRNREDVFGVFTRLNSDDAFAGSGIGLATCARVVQQHRGRIWIEDGIDGGTAVLVWLPTVTADRLAPARRTDEASDVDARG